VLKRALHTSGGLILLLAALSLLLTACIGRSTASPTATVQPTAAVPTPVSLSTATQSPTLAPTLPQASINLRAQELPWWNDAVFYEIFVRSFADSDGDGIGDFVGLTQKLDYLNDGDPDTTTDLGITGIWLMPIQPSPSYHGYDVTDYTAVNPEYGTLEEFKAFLDAAEARDIHVIIDLVLNHTSSEHPWFLSALDGPSSPYYDYYIWSDTDPGIRGPEGQTVWQQADNGRYYYGFFWSGMPDLNYRTPAVTDEMDKVTAFWLEEVGVDGFRLDAVRHLVEEDRVLANTAETHTWLQGFHEQYKTIAPEAVTVGEIWDKSEVVSTYVQGNELDLAFNFDLASAWVLSAVSKDARPASFMLNRDLQEFQPGQFATFLTNHDQNRVMNQVNGEVLRAKTAASLLLTAPGVPFLYYGEEIGMTGQKPDPEIRTPMQWNGERGAGFSSGQPWHELNGDAAEVNVAAQDGDPDSLLSRYRDLIHLRNANPALRSAGAWLVETGDRGVYAVLRASEDQAILVVINLDDEPVTDYALALEEGPLQGGFSAATLYGAGDAPLPPLLANTGGGFDAYQPLPELVPGAVVVIELAP